jgi:hypothetical protein
LAGLELLVHPKPPAELMPDDYRWLAMEIPEAAPAERLDGTPGDTEACVAVGDDFLKRGGALAMIASGVVAPQARNALINGLHGDRVRVRLIGDEAFRFDPRSLDSGAR